VKYYKPPGINYSNWTTTTGWQGNSALKDTQTYNLYLEWTGITTTMEWIYDCLRAIYKEKTELTVQWHDIWCLVFEL
jgi:hypothetical protein